MSEYVFGGACVTFGLVFIGLGYEIIPLLKYDKSDEKMKAVARGLFKFMGFSTLGLGILYFL